MEAGEFGSGGKGVVVEASDVDFAATTTEGNFVSWDTLDGPLIIRCKWKAKVIGGACFTYLRSRLSRDQWRFDDRCLARRRQRGRPAYLKPTYRSGTGGLLAINSR